MNLVSAAEAVKLIKSGDSVYIQGSTSIPEVLVQAMTDRAPELRDVKVYSAFARKRLLKKKIKRRFRSNERLDRK